MRYLPGILAFFFTTAYAAVLNVPQHYPTIQGAIDAARDGDVVLVEPGTYLENIDFKGMAITVKSVHGPDVTVIDGNSKDSVVLFRSKEGKDSVLEGFTLTNGFGHPHSGSNMGGGIFCLESSPTIRSNTIKDNLAYYGGGICCWGYSSNPDILDCQITGNHAPWDPGGGYGKGGGILCRGSSALISGCTIRENTCSDRGGGIGGHMTCSPVIENNLIDSNTASSMGSGFGGGFGCTNGTTPVIRNNVFTNNTAGEGGGLSLWGGIVTNNVIMYNTAKREYSPNTVGYGGGMQILSSIFLPTIKYNIVSHNSALTSGGGVTWGTLGGEFSNNIVCYNEASGGTNPYAPKAGGGLAVYSYSGFDKCQNNIIFGNYAEEYGGGIYLYDNTYATFTNLTLTNNGAPSGSGVYCSDTGNLTLANSIIWDNPGTEIVHGQTDPRITYSNVKGGWPGPGNIGQDPEFVDRANDDFHLLYHSPCRNAGDNNAPQLPLDDFEDDPRIAEGVVDMGADEFHSHLYFTGDSTPGGSVELKFVGIPGTSPVGLWISAASLTDPINGKFGSWYLLPPMLFMGPIPPIPAPGGVESIPGAIPQNPPAPYSLYLQAFLGDKLSNLCLMEVE